MARFNPDSSTDLKRLRDSMQWSRKELRNHVEKFVENLTQYVGSRYGAEGHDAMLPLNMQRLAVDVWARKIVTRAPACLALTRNQSLKTRAFEFQLGLNHVIKEINLGDTLEELTKSALLGFAACKIGIEPMPDFEEEGYAVDPGRVYCEAILWEDFAYDMNARRAYEWDYVGNRYRVDYDDIIENPMYNPEAVRTISPEGPSKDDSDFEGSENVRSTISHSQDDFKQQEYRYHVELWDIYLPKDRLLITLPAEGDGPPLMIRNWNGPKRGPYKMLNLFKVPGNVIGAPPASMIYDMNDLLNKVFVKIGRQGNAQRTVTLVSPLAAGSGDGKNVVEAKDGEAVTVTDPKAVNQMSLGGVNPQSLQFAMWLRQMLNYAGGNIDLIGGLGSQSPTASQDKILSAGSSELIADLQSQVEKFVREIIKDLGWWIFHDQVSVWPLAKSIRGTSDFQGFNYGPERRDPEQYPYFDIDIEPHTMRTQSPEERMQKILALVMQVIAPMLPALQQQGRVLNVDALMKLISRYDDLPELDDLIVQVMLPQTMQPQQGGDGGGQTGPPSTTRNYVRQSQSASGTQNGREATLMQSLAASGNANTPQQAMSAAG